MKFSAAQIHTGQRCSRRAPQLYHRPWPWPWPWHLPDTPRDTWVPLHKDWPQDEPTTLYTHTRGGSGIANPAPHGLPARSGAGPPPTSTQRPAGALPALPPATGPLHMLLPHLVVRVAVFPSRFRGKALTPKGAYKRRLHRSPTPRTTPRAPAPGRHVPRADDVTTPLRTQRPPFPPPPPAHPTSASEPLWASGPFRLRMVLTPTHAFCPLDTELSGL